MVQPSPHLNIGDPAPDIVVSDIQGKPVHLADYWKKDRLTLVSFLRHFGCIHCRARLAELETHREVLHKAGFKLVTLALGEPKHAERYCGKLAPHLDCLADDKNEGYYAWGLKQGTTSEFLTHSMDVMKASLKAMANGHMQGVATGDAHMLPGTFIVDAAGTIRYAYYSDYAGDDPSIETLIQMAQTIQQPV